MNPAVTWAFARTAERLVASCEQAGIALRAFGDAGRAWIDSLTAEQRAEWAAIVFPDSANAGETARSDG